MADQEHLEILQQGVKAWNEWRDHNPGIEPNLREADLQGADLTYATLTEADLTGANLTKADLSGALLMRANLKGANLFAANLKHAALTQANLEEANLTIADLKGAGLGSVRLKGADLQEANLEAVRLDGADLTGANLEGAVLSGASLTGANLREANLTEADLTGANLRNANLKNARLREANLSDSNLREAQNFVLDDTFVRSTRFRAKSGDRWSVLRRNYTGPMFLFHVIFLIVFLGVYSGKAMIWVGVNLGQKSLETVSARITEAGERLEASNREKGTDLRRELDQIWNDESLDPKSMAAISELIDTKIIQPGLQLQGEAVREITTTLDSISACLQPECLDPQPVWRVLLQVDQGLVPMALAVGLIVYNAIRWWFTRQVSFLRDAEERSNYSPLYRDYNWIYLIHTWVMWPLFAVAVASLLFNAYIVLFDTAVILPDPEAAGRMADALLQ